MDLFKKHAETCSSCKLFPISSACFEGAKLLNPDLPYSEEEYYRNLDETDEDD